MEIDPEIARDRSAGHNDSCRERLRLRIPRRRLYHAADPLAPGIGDRGLGVEPGIPRPAGDHAGPVRLASALPAGDVRAGAGDRRGSGVDRPGLVADRPRTGPVRGPVVAAGGLGAAVVPGRVLPLRPGGRQRADDPAESRDQAHGPAGRVGDGPRGPVSLSPAHRRREGHHDLGTDAHRRGPRPGRGDGQARARPRGAAGPDDRGDHPLGARAAVRYRAPCHPRCVPGEPAGRGPTGCRGPGHGRSPRGRPLRADQPLLPRVRSARRPDRGLGRGQSRHRSDRAGRSRLGSTDARQRLESPQAHGAGLVRPSRGSRVSPRCPAGQLPPEHVRAGAVPRALRDLQPVKLRGELPSRPRPRPGRARRRLPRRPSSG